MITLNGNVLFFVSFLVFSIPASVIDIKNKRIPDWTVLSGIVILFVLRLFSIGDPAGRIILEMLTGSSIFIVVRLFTKGKLGMGDVKFAALMAVFVGFPGLFIAAGLASVLGLVYAMAGLITGRLNKSSKIPFAPFLTVGSIGAYFINYDILLKY